ncbi:probable fucosyltransferase 8 [Selaginella moellendorffii]|uniref:probable fucosyltransferase 8 n=1 Tax=Selaginella moellendorffii TaxID=88036 RepID=UPI000D1C2E6E|nr:probable fucosyltransferase 8 [Selaginella moellendorffii]|eukprot:XP_024539944.1 probable fucosyltransferase 8 [Selaginella moellendorffii]
MASYSNPKSIALITTGLFFLYVLLSQNHFPDKIVEDLIVPEQGDARQCRSRVEFQSYRRKSTDPSAESYSPSPALIVPEQGDARQCRSRVEFQSYRRKSTDPSAESYSPSPALIHRLRRYEQIHARCSRLIQDDPNGDHGDCQFVVWIAPFGSQGLGNKMLAIASTFLYALLTNRVLLIARDSSAENMDRLFCEPFPKSSWLLPRPLEIRLSTVNDSSRIGHAPDLKITPQHCHDFASSIKFPDVAYSYLSVDYTPDDRKFFCKEQQKLLQSQVTWLFLRSNVYFAPGLFLVESFRSDLAKLFPQQQAIFHHLSRYLFHPIDPVWDRTARFYDSYLARADRVVGIQMRVPPHLQGVRQNLAAEVFQCAVETKILPNISKNNVERIKLRSSISSQQQQIAAVVTSLDEHHFDVLREIYLNSSTADGSIVRVEQPSHEGQQHTGFLDHDEKALAEIYLLGLSDVLITSPGSTFGYIGQGLAGLRPWLMWAGPGSGRDICSKARTMDPCFFSFGESNCDCGEAVKLDNVERCQDWPIAPGVQLKTT